MKTTIKLILFIISQIEFFTDDKPLYWFFVSAYWFVNIMEEYK